MLTVCALALALLLAVAGVVVPGGVQAQDVAGGHALVSNHGEVTASLAIEAGSGLRSSPPFEGTGTPPAEGAVTLSGAELEALLALPGLYMGDSPESIIGTDDRFRITPTTGYPERAIALITFDGGRCTGWLYGRDVVATAGHCVHSGGRDGDWKTNVVVYPGADGTDCDGLCQPFGSCGAESLWSVRGWTRQRNEKYDYGIIKLDCDVGNTTGWFGYWWQSASLTGLTSFVDGYPGDKPLEQWASNDRIRRTLSRQLFYENDTVGGNSGGPVWQNREGALFCNGACVMGIHAYGQHGVCIFGFLTPHGCYNHGTRIVRAVFNNLQFVKNLP